MFRKYAGNFREAFTRNTSAGLLLIFSVRLALEITKYSVVQICQFILIRRNQTCFSHGHINSIYITHLMCDLISKKMQMSHMDLKMIWR